ncbi:MAG: type II toxin-antitoxin system VapC family toxin [Planctomycetaceae bacterium]|nr:type II toxin-antitoxin system VapC family toxin [Planctomycetaceae bacterium]
MSDTVVDSSVVAKWILPEADSAQAQQLITDIAAVGEKLIVFDLVFPEVANAIWKRHRQGQITLSEAESFIAALNGAPVHVRAASGLLDPAFQIAARYDRAIYDALFVALAQDLSLPGVTADEPLYNVVRADFPQIRLLRNWP